MYGVCILRPFICSGALIFLTSYHSDEDPNLPQTFMCFRCALCFGQNREELQSLPGSKSKLSSFYQLAIFRYRLIRQDITFANCSNKACLESSRAASLECDGPRQGHRSVEAWINVICTEVKSSRVQTRPSRSAFPSSEDRKCVY